MCFPALKIHVSEDCYRLLKEIGGYNFLKRGEVYLKVCTVIGVCMISFISCVITLSHNSW